MTGREPAESAESTRAPHPDIEAGFSDYYDGSLDDRRRGEIEAHLAQCESCRAAYQAFRGTVSALSDLHKMVAPQHFGEGVQDTIRRRSRGRFFGRRAFGDRVPFEALAVVVLVLGLIAFFLIRSSQTGSMRYDPPAEQPDIAPNAREVVPQLAPGPTRSTPEDLR